MSNKEISCADNSVMRYRHDLLNWRYEQLEKTSAFSMEEWARLSNLSGPTIKRIRLGQNVSVDVLKAAASAVCIDTQFLFKSEFQFRRAVLKGHSDSARR